MVKEATADVLLKTRAHVGKATEKVSDLYNEGVNAVDNNALTPLRAPHFIANTVGGDSGFVTLIHPGVDEVGVIIFAVTAGTLILSALIPPLTKLLPQETASENLLNLLSKKYAELYNYCDKSFYKKTGMYQVNLSTKNQYDEVQSSISLLEKKITSEIKQTLGWESVSFHAVAGQVIVTGEKTNSHSETLKIKKISRFETISDYFATPLSIDQKLDGDGNAYAKIRNLFPNNQIEFFKEAKVSNKKLSFKILNAKNKEELTKIINESQLWGEEISISLSEQETSLKVEITYTAPEQVKTVQPLKSKANPYGANWLEKIINVISLREVPTDEENKGSKHWFVSSLRSFRDTLWTAATAQSMAFWLPWMTGMIVVAILTGFGVATVGMSPFVLSIIIAVSLAPPAIYLSYKLLAWVLNLVIPSSFTKMDNGNGYVALNRVRELITTADFEKVARNVLTSEYLEKLGKTQLSPIQKPTLTQEQIVKASVLNDSKTLANLKANNSSFFYKATTIIKAMLPKAALYFTLIILSTWVTIEATTLILGLISATAAAAFAASPITVIVMISFGIIAGIVAATIAASNANQERKEMLQKIANAEDNGLIERLKDSEAKINKAIATLKALKDSNQATDKQKELLIELTKAVTNGNFEFIATTGEAPTWRSTLWYYTKLFFSTLYTAVAKGGGGTFLARMAILLTMSIGTLATGVSFSLAPWLIITLIAVSGALWMGLNVAYHLYNKSQEPVYKMVDNLGARVDYLEKIAGSELITNLQPKEPTAIIYNTHNIENSLSEKSIIENTTNLKELLTILVEQDLDKTIPNDLPGMSKKLFSLITEKNDHSMKSRMQKEFIQNNKDRFLNAILFAINHVQEKQADYKGQDGFEALKSARNTTEFFQDLRKEADDYFKAKQVVVKINDRTDDIKEDHEKEATVDYKPENQQKERDATVVFSK